jgi:hypothetical protein
VEQVARVLDHRVKELFPDGAVVRAELLRHGADPGQLTVRVFIPATEEPTAWAAAHRERMEELRRELSLRLPSARLLEFTSDAPDAAVVSAAAPALGAGPARGAVRGAVPGAVPGAPRTARTATGLSARAAGQPTMR